MTWLENLQGCDNLKAFLQHTTVSILVSKIDGSILWANTAFLNWSGYTLIELQKYGWKQISVPGDDFDQDVVKSTTWDSFVPVYSQQKQYYRKNQSPGRGTMTAIRFPPYGEIEFCIVTWIPREGLDAGSLEEIMQQMSASEAAISEIATLVRSASAVSEEQKFVISAMSLAAKYPKITWAIVVSLLGLFGLNNALDILKTFQIVPEPPRNVVPMAPLVQQ